MSIKLRLGEQMASMRDGDGDHYFALLEPSGMIIKGLDQRFNRLHGPHDVLQGVPDEFEGFLREPAIMMGLGSGRVHHFHSFAWRQLLIS